MDLVALLSLCERLPSVVLLILRFSLPSEDAEVNLTLFFFRLDLSLLGTWDPATTVATSSAADSSWTSFSSSTSSPFCPLVAIAFLEAVIGCTCSADRAPKLVGRTLLLLLVGVIFLVQSAPFFWQLGLPLTGRSWSWLASLLGRGLSRLYWAHRRVATTTCVQWSKGPLAVVVRA